MITEKVTYQHLIGISACLALALVAHIKALPLWVLATVAICGGIRLALARSGRGPPPKPVFMVIAGLAIALLFFRFRTFNGLAAGTALLALTAGLKLLETDTKRDIYIVTLVIYFVGVSALLEGDSFWLLAYLIGVCWLTTATLLRLTTARPAPDWRESMRYSGRVLAQALPLALVFWLFFPRFAGPLWQMPNDSTSATTGLGDTMTPGDITNLAQSDEVAFRVSFAADTPPPGERYWRGPVMDIFNGRTWSRASSASVDPTKLQTEGPAYRYTVSLQPHEHNWLFALDWPVEWNRSGAFLNGTNTLVQRDAVSRPIDFIATSFTHVHSAQALSNDTRRRDTSPPRGNPRSTLLAQSLRQSHADDLDFVRAVLDMFTQQAFYYTLTPPKLADDSVDEFLFDTKRGFCGHYASAFTVLMRAAGIPARVVTGYHGGTFNRYADYWILRQSDAHAWSEIWIEGRGWIRVDPTAAIAPGRVERDAGDAATVDEPLASRWQRRTWLADTRLRIDALGQLWRQRILQFDQSSQDRLLEKLHIPEPDGQKLVIVLALALTLVLFWLTWQVRRELHTAPKDIASRAYARFCNKLAAAGIPRRPHEGAEAYGARVSRLRPDLSDSVTRLCRLYSALRYAAPSTALSLGDFEAGVRRFKPQDFPASS